jgi:hypothetical protein
MDFVEHPMAAATLTKVSPASPPQATRNSPSYGPKPDRLRPLPFMRAILRFHPAGGNQGHPSITCAGKGSDVPVVPLPNCPNSFFPQHQSVPSVLRAHVWVPPAATSATSSPSMATHLGEDAMSSVPMPSWPASLCAGGPPPRGDVDNVRAECGDLCRARISVRINPVDGAIAKLTGAVVAPAPERAIGLARTRMPPPRRYLRDLRSKRGHLNRGRLAPGAIPVGRHGAIAEATRPVVSPAPERAVGLSRAREVHACRDLRDIPAY